MVEVDVIRGLNILFIRILLFLNEGVGKSGKKIRIRLAQVKTSFLPFFSYITWGFYYQITIATLKGKYKK